MTPNIHASANPGTSRPSRLLSVAFELPGPSRNSRPTEHEVSNTGPQAASSATISRSSTLSLEYFKDRMYLVGGVSGRIEKVMKSVQLYLPLLNYLSALTDQMKAPRPLPQQAP